MVVEPKYSQGFSGLGQVLAIDKKHTWAFGEVGGAFSTTPGDELLAYRWDGGSWHHVALPRRKLGNLMGPVGAAGADDVWAVGRFVYYEAPSPPKARYYSSTTIRWNGKKWTVVKKWAGYSLTAMAVVGHDDVWMFGSRVENGRFVPVGLHFDGKTWKRRAVPLIVSTVTVGAKGRLWATGHAGDDWPDGGGQAQALRFDGKRWRKVSDPGCGGAGLLATYRGKPVGTCSRYTKKDTSIGTFVYWQRARWKAETPGVARGWKLGQPVKARDGGLWFLGEADLTAKHALFHRDVHGRWTRTLISPEPLAGGDTYVLDHNHLAAVPGTSILFRAGTIDDVSTVDLSPIGAVATLSTPEGASTSF